MVLKVTPSIVLANANSLFASYNSALVTHLQSQHSSQDITPDSWGENNECLSMSSEELEDSFVEHPLDEKRLELAQRVLSANWLRADAKQLQDFLCSDLSFPVRPDVLYAIHTLPRKDLREALEYLIQTDTRREVVQSALLMHTEFHPSTSFLTKSLETTGLLSSIEQAEVTITSSLALLRRGHDTHIASLEHVLERIAYDVDADSAHVFIRLGTQLGTINPSRARDVLEYWARLGVPGAEKAQERAAYAAQTWHNSPWIYFIQAQQSVPKSFEAIHISSLQDFDALPPLRTCPHITLVHVPRSFPLTVVPAEKATTYGFHEQGAWYSYGTDIVVERQRESLWYMRVLETVQNWTYPPKIDARVQKAAHVMHTS